MKKTMKIAVSLFSIALVLGMITLNSCKKTESLPQIDGYDNSDQVAATYLKAHWTFDDTYNEAISSTAPSNKYGGYSFATGQIGKALNLTAGALVYPSIPNIGGANSLTAFSVSLWVNVKGTKGGTNGFTSFFGIIPTTESDIWGNVMALAETARHPATSDTLELKSYLNTTTSTGQNGQDNLAQLNTGTGEGKWFKGAGKWAHFVMTWDGATRKFMLYGDAVACGAYTQRGTAPPTLPLVMQTPCQAVFGSLAASDIGFSSAPVRGGWYPMATALIDDVRVFNSVLSQADITALYNLGVAGR